MWWQNSYTDVTPYTVIGVAPHGFKVLYVWQCLAIWIPVSMYPQVQFKII